VDDRHKLGLEHIRAGRFFEAHEELELAWRAAPAGERDYLQGLVHVAVAWYQAARGRPVATARQLEKAARRLDRYAHTEVWTWPTSWTRSGAPVSASRRAPCDSIRLASELGEPASRYGFDRPTYSSARLSATCSHQSRWKKRSSPSATSVRPLAAWISV
jgi:hypothetical protein